MAAAVEEWVSWFSCCVAPPPQKRRHRIDRSTIGYPTNFQHTGHVGSGDIEMPERLRALEFQMKNKGGYDSPYKDRDWCQ